MHANYAIKTNSLILKYSTTHPSIHPLISDKKAAKTLLNNAKKLS